ncbi:FtsW/RodA/SpoVE family cell cycle protein [Paenibacillus sp. MMS18-CY102]|uniref:FtsW/RodA/SpoVE family cell cycle protein n=1 Tax=Paenibacillus sp. MMS18-CY102 TaxID=2682849 RepID=UPI0013666671|nr:FtsW/RodA/SpoVE family cell cycle protein [Paenibacillus sp. MMS18-CY102]MWC30640.1 hypothetical protein [Paenibacillus sp. MMS18-CY102]
MNQNIKKHPLVQRFLDRVCAQVRAKAVHADIRTEMLHHLEELYSVKLEEGMAEAEAIEAAVTQMGDPDVVSKQLNAAHKPKVEWSVISLLIGMLIVGVVTMFSMYSALDGGVWVERKLFFVVSGLFVMGVLYFIDYRRWLHLSSLLYVSALLIMAIAHKQGVGVEINGAKQYIAVGAFMFNVCAIAPYVLIIAVAGMLHKEAASGSGSGNELERLIRFSKNVAIYLLVPTCFFIAAPAIGYLLIYLISVSVLLIMKGKWKIIVAGSSVIGAFLAIQALYSLNMQFAWERFSGFFHRSSENSYYMIRSIEAIHDAGMWGQGFGIATRRLPGIASEMTYSYLIYSLGWVFGLLVAVLALLFLLRIVKMGLQIQEGYARGLVLGLSSVFAIQYVWCLLMSIGMLPILGGMQMPIMNWASGTIVELAVIGLMLGAFRRKDMLGSATLLKKAG